MNLGLRYNQTNIVGANDEHVDKIYEPKYNKIVIVWWRIGITHAYDNIDLWFESLCSLIFIFYDYHF